MTELATAITHELASGLRTDDEGNAVVFSVAEALAYLNTQDPRSKVYAYTTNKAVVSLYAGLHQASNGPKPKPETD